TASSAKASGRPYLLIFEAGDASKALRYAEAASPTADVSSVCGTVSVPSCPRMIVPSPASRKIDLDANLAAKALTDHGRRRPFSYSPGCRFPHIQPRLSVHIRAPAHPPP